MPRPLRIEGVMQLQVGSSHIAGETIRTPHEIILVDCSDEVGLIHRITGVLASQQFNIESNQEFVDVTTSHFFFPRGSVFENILFD